MELPPANALRAFEATARLLSVSKAGDELHVTHAAVSHHIRHLEEWLGQPLFRKSGRNIALTDAGRALGAVATDCFRQIEAQCRSLRRAGTARSVTIACIPSIASRWLIPGLGDFQVRNPAIELRVIYAKASDRLGNLDADVLITLTAGNERATKSQRLFSRANRPVASPHYLARKGPLDNAAAIAGADLLHDESPVNWNIWFRAAGVSPSPPARGPIFQDFNLMATAVIAGHGVALCPVEVFSREIAAGDIVVLSDIATLEDESYFMVTPDKASADIRAFTRWFQDHLAATRNELTDPAPAARP
jgi:LysR family transcriptional regulator, glycine cleavage system transcriptional activator